MVSSLFLPAACRCVLSPLYPVPTHLKRGFVLSFPLIIRTFIRLFLRFSPVLPRFSPERAALSRGKKPICGVRGGLLSSRRGACKGRWPIPPDSEGTGRQTPCTGTAAAKGLRGVPASVLQESASRGRPMKIYSCPLAFPANQKAAPSGTAFAGFISFLAAPGGRPRSGRG